MNTGEYDQWRRKLDGLIEELVRSRVELDAPPKLESFARKWEREKQSAVSYVDTCRRQGFSTGEMQAKLAAIADFVEDMKSFIEDPVGWALREMEGE